MQKVRRKIGVFPVVFIQLFLLVSMSFAVAFIISSESVSAVDPGITNVPTKSAPLPNRPSIGDDTPNLGQAAPAAAGTGGGTLTKATGGNAFKNIYGGHLFGIGPESSLVAGLAWAATAYFAVKLVAGLFGASPGLTNALATSVGVAAGVGGFLQSAWAGQATTLANNPILSIFVEHPWITSIGIGVVIFVLTYRSEKKQLVSFQCLPYEPPLGGSQCEQCNKDPFRPCSEYRCQSLGQACKLLNPGTTNEKCTWVSKFDVNSPVIEVWNLALSPQGLKFTPDDAIRPPNRGVKIQASNGGCLPAYTPLKFGLQTNEPAQCKIDYNNNASFKDMQYYFGESNYYEYNHTQTLRLPGPDTGVQGTLSPILQNDGTFNLYVRCQDANGNANVDLFAINFCVDKGPDTTPPLIEATSIISGSPVRYNADNVPMQVFVNEPAQCKWSRSDKDYKDMENSMQCGTESYQVNANLQYTCSGNLTGIKNRESNTFYFRCEDQPNKAESQRNPMRQSTALVLRGSQPLNIVSAQPNGTIYGSTETIPMTLSVQTDDGSDEGKATCYFSSTGAQNSYTSMINTNDFKHSQPLDLPSGTYTYFFRCIDAGGNAADAKISFSVIADREAPSVTRVYRDSTDSMKVITNEDAECAYSLNSCDFTLKEGTALLSTPSNKVAHFGPWKPGVTYYIKCKDLLGNEPSPNECSLIASATQIAKQL
ncbi:hypothetical protein KW805_04840 [Candidatus Pacearchaeota archaeon]|nr:hypothetical protein [Candidatus Pacearchaeota archaeon]